MFALMLISIFIIFDSTCSNKFHPTQDPFHVNIGIQENQTFLISYNLTSNCSYYITFRLFEQEPYKFGSFPPTNGHIFNSIYIRSQAYSKSDDAYFFIICFHFLCSSDDLNVQCKDIRGLTSNTEAESLPSYKPLFVPMMYALSILMLLPVIVQHRRQKRAQLIHRRKELRRLSMSIAQENPNLLARLNENGHSDSKTIPIEIELVSFPSTRTLFDQIDDNDNVTFTKRRDHHPLFSTGNELDEEEEEDEEQLGISADECIAHLLNSTPWTTPIGPVRIPEKYLIHEQEMPMISATEHYDDHRNQHSSTLQLYRTNPAFIESDV